MQRRCWPVLLVLWPYAGIVLAWVRQYDEYPMALWWMWLAGFAMLCLANGICALRRENRNALVGMTAKLLLIPYYIIALLLGMILFISAPPVILMVLLLNGLLLLSTSAYTLRSVYLDWHGGKLTAVWAVILAVTQLIFVLDVPGSIALYLYEKRRSH